MLKYFVRVSLKNGSEIYFVTSVNPDRAIEIWKDSKNSFESDEKIITFRGCLDTCLRETFEANVLMEQISAMTVSVCNDS